MVACAFAAFMLSRKAKPSYSGFISIASKSTLAVYILHVALQDMLADLFRITYLYETPWWLPGMIAVSVLIYAAVSVPFTAIIYIRNRFILPKGFKSV